MWGGGQPAGVGGRGRRGAAGAGSTKRLWECREQGNDEGHVTQCKLKCGGGGKEKRSRQAEIWKSRPRRTVLKSAGNACMPFSTFFSRSACFLPEEMTPCTQGRACWVEGLQERRECVQSGVDLEAGGLLSTFPENRGERRSEQIF